MKKVLIFRDRWEVGGHFREKTLATYLQKKLSPEIEVITSDLVDTVLEIETDKVRAEINQQPITDFDLVWFRRTSKGFAFFAKAIAAVLDTLEIKYFDSAWGKNKIVNKLPEMVFLAQAGVPIPPTFFCWRTKILEQRQKIVKFLGLPLVAKDIFEDKGRGVFLLKKPEDFENLVGQSGKDNHFIFQKFCPNDGDYRILVLDGKIASWEKRTRQTEEFRNNVALGAKEEFFPLEKIPQEFKVVAEKAAKVVNLEIAGVDLLEEKETGKIWILEVNRSPVFTEDVNVSPEIPAIASFLKKQLA